MFSAKCYVFDWVIKKLKQKIKLKISLLVDWVTVKLKKTNFWLGLLF